MKLAARNIDICKRQRASMCSVGQKNEHSFAVRIDPATGSRKSGVAKSVYGKGRAGGRIFSGSELPGERARFIQSFSHVLQEELASLGREQLRLARNELISQTQSFVRAREQTCVTRRAAEKVGVAIVNVAPHNSVSPAAIVRNSF